MLFCPKCGSILRPKKDKNKKALFCTCGYIKKDAESTEIKEHLEEEKEVEVIEEETETYLRQIQNAQNASTEQHTTGCNKCGAVTSQKHDSTNARNASIFGEKVNKTTVA